MAQYVYKIITPQRNLQEGTVESIAAFFVRRSLERENNTVLYVQRQGSEMLSRFSLFGYVSMSSMYHILLFRNCAMMLDAGIPLSSVLHTLALQARGFGVKAMMMSIHKDVMNGMPLSRAMEKYPKVFPVYITKTVEVGEQSGTMSQTMEKISLDLEREYELRRKLIGAIAYPSIILLFMIVTAIMLVVMVLPQITTMFADLDAPLPPATKALQTFGDFLRGYPLQILAGLVASGVVYALLMRIRSVRIVVHSAVLRMPIFGNLLKEYNLSRITRSLGTLLASGIGFVQAFDTAKGTIRNESYIMHMERLYPVILHGGQLSDAMLMAPFHFPEQLRHLIAVGEQSGKLRSSFEKASLHYDRSVSFQTQMLTTLLEPILMLIAGVLVGLLAFSIFSPLYNVATLI